jgi:hypothetical protein
VVAVSFFDLLLLLALLVLSVILLYNCAASCFCILMQ